MKSCDSSRFWLIVERLIIIENKNLTEIGSDLQEIFVINYNSPLQVLHLAPHILMRGVVTRSFRFDFLTH